MSFLLLFLMVPSVSEASEQVHNVKKGESLWKIAVLYEVGISELIEANQQIPNMDLIYPDQKINIPSFAAQKGVESEVLRLTNIKRKAAGLKPLQMNWELQRVARIKAEDLRDKNYFSHQSPTYGSPFDMMKQFGIRYQEAGENIAARQPSPQQVIVEWMNSEGHRRNILNPNYTHLGFGYARGGQQQFVWVQMFIHK